jgi:hypothetical protein
MESCEAGQQDRKAAHLHASSIEERPEPFSPLPTKEEDEEGYTNQRICFLQPVYSSGGTNRLQGAASRQAAYPPLCVSPSRTVCSIYPILPSLSRALDLCVCVCL